MKNTMIMAATLIAFAGTAFAQTEAEMAIKARKGLMNFYQLNLGSLGAMAKGDLPYDAAAATTAATNIAAVAHLNGSMLWPQGTDADTVPESRALPAIWAEGSDIGAKAGALREAANAMVTAAGTDLAALQAAIGPLGEACAGCHKAYRAPE